MPGRSRKSVTNLNLAGRMTTAHNEGSLSSTEIYRQAILAPVQGARFQPDASINQAPRIPALATHGLSKSFGKPAVDKLDLVIRGGEFYALLGPNGAGKTTTLRMVVGLLQAATPESISVFGIDAPRRAGRRQTP